MATGTRTKKVLPGSVSLFQHQISPAVVRARSSITNAQTQSRAFANLFGGVKGIEDFLRISDACAVIPDRYFEGRAPPPRRDFNVAALSGFLHCVIGVVQNIQEDLLQLLRISERRRESFFKVFCHLYTVAGKVITSQFNGLPQHLIQLHQLALHRPLSSETQQILNDILYALRATSCRMICRSSRAVAGTLGFSSSKSVNPKIAASGLFTSCATPDTRRPMVAIFSLWASLACSSAASVMSVITTTTLFTTFCSSRMGLKLMEKCPIDPSLRRTGSSIFSTCLAVRRGFQRRRELFAMARVHPVHQTVADQLFLFDTPPP